MGSADAAGSKHTLWIAPAPPAKGIYRVDVVSATAAGVVFTL